jgi:hypothetical protein
VLPLALSPPARCLALRLGEEFHDLGDVGVLVRELSLKSVAEAESILSQYYDSARYPAKARYLLEELIGARDDGEN